MAENSTGLQTERVPIYSVTCGWIRRTELYELGERYICGKSNEMVSIGDIEPLYSINMPSLDEAVETIKRCYPMLSRSACTVLDADNWVLVEFTRQGDWQITALFKVLKAFFVATKIDMEKAIANMIAVQDGPVRDDPHLVWRDEPLMRSGAD
jgi:hypothetical protein